METKDAAVAPDTKVVPQHFQDSDPDQLEFPGTLTYQWHYSPEGFARTRTGQRRKWATGEPDLGVRRPDRGPTSDQEGERGFEVIVIISA